MYTHVVSLSIDVICYAVCYAICYVICYIYATYQAIPRFLNQEQGPKRRQDSAKNWAAARLGRIAETAPGRAAG